jgi:hypothetical protein
MKHIPSGILHISVFNEELLIIDIINSDTKNINYIKRLEYMKCIFCDLNILNVRIISIYTHNTRNVSISRHDDIGDMYYKNICTGKEFLNRNYYKRLYIILAIGYLTCNESTKPTDHGMFILKECIGSSEKIVLNEHLNAVLYGYIETTDDEQGMPIFKISHVSKKKYKKLNAKLVNNEITVYKSYQMNNKINNMCVLHPIVSNSPYTDDTLCYATEFLHRRVKSKNKIVTKIYPSTSDIIEIKLKDIIKFIRYSTTPNGCKREDTRN